MQRLAPWIPTLLWLVVPLAAAGDAAGTARNGSGCLPCHGVVPNALVSVMIDGPAEVPAGGSALYSAWIAPAGAGAAIDASLDAAALAAGWTVLPVDPLLRSFGAGSVVQSDAHPRVWSFDFELVAPLAPVDATLRVAMMAFDGDGLDTALDVWNTASAPVSVPEPPGSAVAAALALALLARIGRAGGSRRRRGTLRGGGASAPRRREPCPWIPASSDARPTRSGSRSMRAG